MEHYELDELDEKILSMMVKDARKPFLEVARECNVSGAAIHQRIQKLTHAGVVKGSEFIIDNSKIGFKTCAYMGLFLQSSDQYATITEELKLIPEIVECHHTTGKYDLFIKIYARDNEHLLSIIHKKLLPLGLARTETLISFKEGFRRRLPIDIGKLEQKKETETEAGMEELLEEPKESKGNEFGELKMPEKVNVPNEE